MTFSEDIGKDVEILLYSKEIPADIVKVYCCCIVMANLFSQTAEGENYRNITEQLARLLGRLNYDVGQHMETLAPILEKYLSEIQKARQQIGEEIKKQMK